MTEYVNSGSYNSGDRNIGRYNIGDGNRGDSNIGNMNIGYFNNGDWNSGNHNIGSHNIGGWNIGYYNNGNRNIGRYNIGDNNIGKCNIGDWNIGDRNNGYLNTITPTSGYIFNKLTENICEITFPDWMYFSLNDKLTIEQQQIVAKLTKEEQIELYKSAAQKAWANAPQEEKEQTFNLPNFDADIFYEIFGIDVRKNITNLDEEIVVNGIRYKKVSD